MRCIVLDEITFPYWNIFHKESMFFSFWKISDTNQERNFQLNAIVFSKKILSAFRWWDEKFFLGEKDKELEIGGIIDYWYSYREFVFWTLMSLDYKQNYMMLLEQCDHIVVIALPAVTCLNKDETHVCYVTWMDYSIVFT